MRFNVTNVKGENPMHVKQFIVLGDGESSRLSIPLEASPVGMEFRLGGKPSYAFMRQSSGCGDVQLSTESGTLHIEFDRRPAKGERVEIDIEFFYEG